MVMDEMVHCRICKRHVARGKSFCTCAVILAEAQLHYDWSENRGTERRKGEWDDREKNSILVFRRASHVQQVLPCLYDFLSRKQVHAGDARCRTHWWNREAAPSVASARTDDRKDVATYRSTETTWPGPGERLAWSRTRRRCLR